MCAHTHKERESALVSYTHTHTHTHTNTHGLSPHNTNSGEVCFLNVVILNRCKQWQEA